MTGKNFCEIVELLKPLYPNKNDSDFLNKRTILSNAAFFLGENKVGLFGITCNEWFTAIFRAKFGSGVMPI